MRQDMLPGEIEAKSFAIIYDRLGEREFPDATASIVKRVIHASADFDYADTYDVCARRGCSRA